MTTPLTGGATAFRPSLFTPATPKGLAERIAATAGSGAAKVLNTASSDAGGDKVQAFIAQFKFSDEQRKDLESQRKVLGDLELASQQAVRDRKSAASERVARIKQELEVLKRFAGIDPKAAARRAAQLARELGAAAKEYAQAGSSVAAGSGTGAGAASTAAATGDVGATDGATGDAATAAAASGVEAQAAAAAASPDAGSTAAKADGGEGEAKTDRTASGSESAKGQDQTPGARRDKDADWHVRLSAEAKERAAEAKADSEFASTVKSLAAQLKAIIERAAKAAKNGTDDVGAADGEQGLREAEDAATAIQGAALSALSGATGIAVPPATLISISV